MAQDPFKLFVQVISLTILLAVIGVFSVWAQQPWLVPSLGSAAFIQVLTPHVPSARVWPMSIGQLCGIAGGFAGVYAVAAASAPAFMEGNSLFYVRVAAVIVATLVTAVLQLGLKAVSAAGGTLALLIALGSEAATWGGLVRLLIGVALVTGLGETLRRIIMGMSQDQREV